MQFVLKHAASAVAAITGGREGSREVGRAIALETKHFWRVGGGIDMVGAGSREVTFTERKHNNVNLQCTEKRQIN